MSGEFRKFRGLKTHKNSSRVDGPSYLGIPCLYHAHSGHKGVSETMRDSLTHACLECSQYISNGRFGLDVTRLSTKNQKKALNFWSKVDIGEWDECWRWTADSIQKQLYHVWNRKELRNLFRHHPILVMMWVTWGDVGRLGSVSLCGERRCCNPLHNIPVDLLQSVDISDYSDEWLNQERKVLLEQIAEYQFNKSNDIKTSIIIGDGLLDDTGGQRNPTVITPFQQKLLAMHESLLDGTHSMLLDEIVSDKNR